MVEDLLRGDAELVEAFCKAASIRCESLDPRDGQLVGTRALMDQRGPTTSLMHWALTQFTFAAAERLRCESPETSTNEEGAGCPSHALPLTWVAPTMDLARVSSDAPNDAALCRTGSRTEMQHVRLKSHGLVEAYQGRPILSA